VDLVSFQMLLCENGQQALQEAAALGSAESDFLRNFSLLKRKYPAELARAALETAILRKAAQSKFPEAEKMYFTRPALEQASSFQVSSYRLERFKPFKLLADLGCSIGGDSLALARLSPTLGLDLDPLRLAMAKVNLEALGLSQSARFAQADLRHGLPIRLDPYTGLFFDPARRTGDRRAFSVKDYQPPLAIVHAWLGRFPALGVKISPGVKLAELSGYQAEIEFISLAGELKEAVLWFGPLRTASRRATILPGGFSLVKMDYEHNGKPDVSLGQSGLLPSRLPLTEPQAYLYEPDPAVLRAGLVETLGEQLEAAQLDPDIAYLTSTQSRETDFARCWEVETWFPFQLKRLREALRQRRVGRVTVKKRGSPLQPEELITQLRLSGDERRVVFLTHLKGKPIVILAYENQSAEN
jgi:hypothetical protein